MSYVDVLSAISRFRSQLHTFLLRSSCAHIGKDSVIDYTVRIVNPSKLWIGDEVEIRQGAIVNARSDKEIGIKLENGAHIHQYAYLDSYGGSITLGRGVRIGHHSVIAGHGGVSFGDWSGVSGLSYVIAANHNFEDGGPHVLNEETKNGIAIGENVWGGCGVIICDGVSIGDGAVIGAGAVVRCNVETNMVMMGNPARVIYEHNAELKNGRPNEI